MGFEEQFREIVRGALSTKKQNELAEASGVSQGAISQFASGKRQSLKLESVGRLFDALGITMVTPEQRVASREVHLIDVTSSLPDGETPVAPENYRAVPLISNVGAGPGIIRNEYDEPKEWFLVNRNVKSMVGKQVDKFFAVRIANNSTSMEPVLHPGDTVLINPTDKDVSSPGGIFLVLDPGPDGGGKIKRVNVEKVPALKVTRLTFYSDNVAENPPEVHILEHDYENDISRAIVGRVIWAWTDLSKK